MTDREALLLAKEALDSAPGSSITGDPHSWALRTRKPALRAIEDALAKPLIKDSEALLAAIEEESDAYDRMVQAAKRIEVAFTNYLDTAHFHVTAPEQGRLYPEACAALADFRAALKEVEGS